MTTEVLTYVIGAGATVRAPRGRLFFVKSAPNGGLTITAAGRPGSPLKFANISAGLKYGPVDESEVWQYLEITSATAQTVEMIIGDDDVELAGTVSVAGTVSTVDIGRTFGSAADQSVAATTQVQVFRTAGRMAVIVGSLSTNAGSIRIGDGATSATEGLELQPGEKIALNVETNVFVYNPNASAITINVLEVY